MACHTCHTVRVTSRYWRPDYEQIVTVPDYFPHGSEQEWNVIRYRCGIRGKRENYTVELIE